MLYAALINLAVLAAIFVPLERAFPARVQRVMRPQLVLDGCFFLGQYLVTQSAILAVLGALAPLHGHALSHASPVLQVVSAVVLADFVVYWFHRACHRFEFLWRFHAVHHTAEHLDWVAAHREHPLDGIVTATLMNLPAIALGVRPELLAGVAVFRAGFAIFVHSNVRLPLGPLKYLFGAPEYHHFHHAKENVGHNFANLAPYWDVVFGTHHCPERDDYELGVGAEYPRNYAALVLWPLRRGSRAFVTPLIVAATLVACAREAPPVAKQLPAEPPRATPPSASAQPVSHINAIVLVLQASIAAASKDGAMRAVASLSAVDVGVIAYGRAPSVVVKLGSVHESAQFEKALAAIPAQPGAALTSALRLAHAELSAADSKLKHVIVIAEARNDEPGADAEAKAMFHDLIGCSAIGVGKDADEKELAALAKLGAGGYRAVESPAKLAPAMQAELSTVLGP